MHLTKIEKLQTQNFRNLSSQVFQFSPHINCIFGQNGNGKTNVLEAIYFLCKRKSFRKKASLPQMLNIDGNDQKIIINGIFSDGDSQPHQLTCTLEQEQNNWFMDSKPFKKRQALSCIFINPFDSYQFYNAASFRRDLIDDLISDLSEGYSTSLNRYDKYLRQRNKLLQTGEYELDRQLDALDSAILEDIEFITKERKKFILEINEYLSPIYRQLFAEDADLKLQIEHSYSGLSKDQIFSIIKSKRERDKSASLTLSGIHKDDALLFYNGLNSAEYCSLGQQKMAFLSLFFAFIELFGYKFESYPLVLLDDVSGELDSNRWGRLVEFLNERKFQVLITTANEKFRESLENIEGANKFYVQQGTIVK
ncbi:MAG: DNA replication and repair protein RecF [Bdellovibrio sp.]